MLFDAFSGWAGSPLFILLLFGSDMWPARRTTTNHHCNIRMCRVERHPKMEMDEMKKTKWHIWINCLETITCSFCWCKTKEQKDKKNKIICATGKCRYVNEYIGLVLSDMNVEYLWWCSSKCRWNGSGKWQLWFRFRGTQCNLVSQGIFTCLDKGVVASYSILLITIPILDSSFEANQDC